MDYKGYHINNAHDVVEWWKTHFIVPKNIYNTSSQEDQVIAFRFTCVILGIAHSLTSSNHYPLLLSNCAYLHYISAMR